MAALKPVVGGLVGAGIGLALSLLTRGAGGGCPLTCNPYVAPVVWGVMGVLVGLALRR